MLCCGFGWVDLVCVSEFAGGVWFLGVVWWLLGSVEW